MESIINSLKSLFTTYGFRAAAVIIATVAIVNLIKIPIVKYATKRAEASGKDKSAWTKFITVLPVGVAFVLEFIIELTINKFCFTALPFGEICSHAVLYGALAVATYESVKKQLEAYATNKNQAKPNSDGDNHNDGDNHSDDAQNSNNNIAFSSNG